MPVRDGVTSPDLTEATGYSHAKANITRLTVAQALAGANATVVYSQRRDFV